MSEKTLGFGYNLSLLKVDKTTKNIFILKNDEKNKRYVNI